MSRKRGHVSITTIAKEMGVSVASISRVMNNRTGVSEHLRRKILKRLRAHDFKTNYPAPRKQKIAVVGSSPRVDYYSAMLWNGIFACLQEAGVLPCTLFYEYKRGEKEKLLALLRDQQCAGAILTLHEGFSRELPELAKSGLPVMLLDETSDLPGIGHIDNDSYSGSLEAARLLTGLGHRKIGYVASSAFTRNHEQRVKGCRDALAEIGCDDLPILETPAQGRTEAVRLFLTQHPELTAVMATNDIFAIHVLRAAYDLRLKVPDDLSVIGFDDYTVSAELCPPLTTVRRPLTEAGRMAAAAVCDFLKSNGKTPLPRIVTQTELVVRETTCPPRDRVVAQTEPVARDATCPPGEGEA